MGGNGSKLEPEKLSQIPSSFDDDDVIFQFDPESYSQGSLLDMDTTLLVLRTISSCAPILKPLYSLPKAILDKKKHVDNILNLVGNVNQICKLMMDAKISKAKIDMAKSLLNAECATLKIARARMYDENGSITLNDKKDEVVPAFQSCIRVMTLFSDKSFAFWKNIIPSSELVLHFSALYLDVMWHSVSFKKSYRRNVIKALKDMMSTLEEYRDKCVKQRAKYVYYTRVTFMMDVDEAALISHEFGDRWGKPWVKHIWDVNRRGVNRAKVEIEEYEENVKTTYANMFDKAIRSYDRLLEKI